MPQRVPLLARILRSATAGALLLALAACEEVTFVPYPVATDYRKQQQTPRLLRPGWRLTGVARRVDRPTAIVHRVEVIPDVAGDLIRMGRRRREKLVGEVACPAADDPIWQQLSRGQDVEVDLSTEKRGELATVSCRSALF